jgi:hypothetical protein
MIVLVGGVVGVTAELSTEHSVDITGSIDVPAQTVETEWGEATITEVGKEEAGETLEVSTDVPENESYVIRTVDSNEDNVEGKFVEGDVERDFSLTGYLPGTYVVALLDGQTALEVEPFIVKGYSVDQSVNDVTKGEIISVSIQLTKVNSRADEPQVINTTLFGNGVVRSIEATSTSEDSYQANFSTDDLPTGSYDVYTGAENDDDIYGYDELIGLSDSASVEVKEDSTPTPTSTVTPTPTSTATESPESTTKPDETSTSVGGGFDTEGSETVTSAAEEVSTQTAQSTSTPISNQSNDDEATGTGTQTRGQVSESTTVETAPQPTERESESTTTSSEMPILSSGGIVVCLGILIGTIYRLRCSV